MDNISTIKFRTVVCEISTVDGISSSVTDVKAKHRALSTVGTTSRGGTGRGVQGSGQPRPRPLVGIAQIRWVSLDGGRGQCLVCLTHQQQANVYTATGILQHANYIPLQLFFFVKINTYFSKVLQLLGDFVPRPPTGALPLDPTRGLPSPRPPDLGPPVKNLQCRP